MSSSSSSTKSVAFVIRRAGEADAAGILACLTAAFAPYRPQYTPAGFADTVLSQQTIAQRLREMHVFAAVTPSGEIIGTIGGAVSETPRGAEGHIRGMAVLPAWQGAGVAKALLDTVEWDLRDRGAGRITLDTTRPLARAIAFYTRNGYKPTGVIGNFFGMELIEFAKM